MRIIEPSVTTMSLVPTREDLYNLIEAAGRLCYQSERVEGDTQEDFIQRIMRRGHESVLEHGVVSLKFICDRGVSHELVRHRIASYSQESTRYCNYSQGRFGNEITVIKPCFFSEDSRGYETWKRACEFAESYYLDMLKLGRSPQEARSVLPNSLKTEIVVTMNLRQWRHFCSLRYFGTTGKPHPQMVEVAQKAFYLLYDLYPIFFEDLLALNN